MLQPGTLLVFVFTYKNSSCNSSFTAVPTCCEPAALLSAGLCLQESSVSLFVLLAQKLFFWLPTCNPGQHPSRGARSSKIPPSLRLSVLPPSCCLYSQKISRLTFPQQTFLGWFLDSQERAGSGTFLLPRTKLWGAGLALSLSFPRQG